MDNDNIKNEYRKRRKIGSVFKTCVKGTDYVIARYKGKTTMFNLRGYDEDTARKLAAEHIEELIKGEKQPEQDKIEHTIQVEDQQHTNDTMSEVKNEIESIQNKDPSTLFDKNEAYTAAIIGSTKSGKTTFITDLIKKIKHNYDLIILFTNSGQANIYSELQSIKHLITITGFRPQLVKDLKKLNTITENEFRFLCLLDDEIDNKHDMVLKNMFSVYRNSNISTIFSGQDWSFISRSSRNNLNYVFLLKQNNMEAVDGVISKFLFGSVPIPDHIKKRSEKIDYLKQLFLTNTVDHKILILDILDDFALYKYKVNK